MDTTTRELMRDMDTSKNGSEFKRYLLITNMAKTHVTSFDPDDTTMEDALRYMKEKTKQRAVYMNRNGGFQTDRARKTRDRLRQKLAKKQLKCRESEVDTSS